MAVLGHRLDKARDLRGDIHLREHDSQKQVATDDTYSTR